MKIVVKTLSEKAIENFDYCLALKIEVDGNSICFVDGEPEDNSLNRNFRDCFTIIDLLKKAYKAGENGEVLEIEEKILDDVDDL